MLAWGCGCPLVLRGVMGAGLGSSLSSVLGVYGGWLGGEVCSPVLGIVVGTGLGVCLSLVLGVWGALVWGIICSPILWVQWALA